MPRRRCGMSRGRIRVRRRAGVRWTLIECARQRRQVDLSGVRAIGHRCDPGTAERRGAVTDADDQRCGGGRAEHGGDG